MDRRKFLEASAVAGAGFAALGELRPAAAQSPNEQLQLMVVGMGGRGRSLATDFDALPGVRVTHVFDVDESRRKLAVETMKAKNGHAVTAGIDFREQLGDDSIDAVVIATGNYWHAPAAILAMKQGKHVYLEKPCSHNPHEGELLVAAAEKYDRIAQHGTQRRSVPGIVEGIAKLREGVIGRVYNAHCYYRNVRGSIGNGKQGDPPAGLDFDLWQGPAPRRPYTDNLLHYNWHWRWHWGNGELGNNGVHLIDVARMGLGVKTPQQVSSLGGRYRYNDDQETPDTQIAVFTFPGGSQITWEAVSCNRFHPAPTRDEVIFYGEDGAASFNGTGCRIVDLKGKTIAETSGRGGWQEHLENFVAAIRGEATVVAPMPVAHHSALLCHLGNTSYRLGRTLTCEPKTGRIVDDTEAMGFWRRAYEPGWEPTV
ncbi:MAG: gfo/Idh/MocA family oxidoreductase [Planctomycetia bacterium]|nr:gfo/Idh/MocA family oxidoreductase [Planctomycetia bacterium]